MDCIIGSGADDEVEYTPLKKAGAHAHKGAAGGPKAVCKNFGQLPKLTGDWVDHPEPSYKGLYTQACNSSLSYFV